MRRWALVLFVLAAAWAAAPDPVKVESFTFQNPLLPNDQANDVVKGHAVIRNAGRVTVQAVQIIVHIQDGEHHELSQQSQTVASLKPGQEHVFDWDWRNYNTQFIDPLLEVRHRPTDPKADPNKLVVSETRATQPAGGGPVEGGTLQPAPSPSSTTPPGY
ncbi:MAG TPA: hypothetical protein VGO93_11410 [Candidatus Xenobia bacterium]|jgi:hypothetical protein